MQLVFCVVFVSSSNNIRVRNMVTIVIRTSMVTTDIYIYICNDYHVYQCMYACIEYCIGQKLNTLNMYGTGQWISLLSQLFYQLFTICIAKIEMFQMVKAVGVAILQSVECSSSVLIVKWVLVLWVDNLQFHF